MRKVFCPAEIKEIKEIFIPIGEALSAISALSAGRLLPHADSIYCPDFYCPAEIKEIMEIFIPLGAALSAISALSAGHYYLMRKVFYCPAVIGFAASLVEVIGFAASLVEEMKEKKEIQVSEVALGRPSAPKLQGQELQKVK